MPAFMHSAQDVLRRLRMGADNQGLGDGLEAPPRRDTFDLAGGILAWKAAGLQTKTGG